MLLFIFFKQNVFRNAKYFITLKKMLLNYSSKTLSIIFFDWFKKKDLKT